MASFSRGAEGDFEELGRRFGVLKSLGEHAQGKCLNAGHGFVASGAIAEDAGKIGDFGNPAAIFLAVEFDREADAHAATLARVPGRCRTRGCIRRRPRGGEQE